MTSPQVTDALPIEPLQIRFLGGAGTVTGSKYLLTFNGKKILIDCGLFQGLKELRLKNWDRFPIDPATIDAVLLTHAHLDHSGYVPRLVNEGFKGLVYCTHGTLELSKIILLDTGHLQEEEAEYLGKRRLSKHSKPLALFDRADAQQSLKSFVPQDFSRWIKLMPEFEFRFLPAGHILGASMIEIKIQNQKLLFSGDLGRPNDPLFNPPDLAPPTDILVLESTYGQRLHPNTDPINDLAQIIQQASKNKSVIIIPAFTVGRAQTLLHFLAKLKKQGLIPKIPMYLNSPMASSATKVFSEAKNSHKLSKEECDELLSVAHFVETAEQSQALNEKEGPFLVISASGMATGGRVLHHLKKYASDPNNLILITGYQALGTRGRSLADGASEIRIHQQMVPVRAKVQVLENLSAHADRVEILDWLVKSNIHPSKVFITHGEPQDSEALKLALQEKFQWNCIVPSLGQEFLLSRK